MEDRVLLHLRGGEEMAAEGYDLVVRPYMMGQFRLQLLRADRPDEPLVQKDIIRELCTYSSTKAVHTARILADAPDPELTCRRLERPWNCEGPNGRIRLDNGLQDRVEMSRERAAAAYVDPLFPERSCDHCGRPYQGPAVFCSLECAEAAA